MMMVVMMIVRYHYSRSRISFCAFFCHRPCPCEVLSSFFERLLYIDIGAATDDNDDETMTMAMAMLLLLASTSMVLLSAVAAAV